VKRHLREPDRKPIAGHNRRACDILLERVAHEPLPLVLDSFCGTGHSTALLAERHPQHLVVGVDKSASRLSRHPGGERDNYLLLRAECEPLWSLVAAARLRVDYHYLLYPNPWPRPAHLQRRVHGHPGFQSLLRLGGRLELRSNWQIYVEEFGVALHLAGHRGCIARVTGATADLSLFERKYRRSGHDLWACHCDLGPATPAGTGYPAQPGLP